MGTPARAVPESAVIIASDSGNVKYPGRSF